MFETGRLSDRSGSDIDPCDCELVHIQVISPLLYREEVRYLRSPAGYSRTRCEKCSFPQMCYHGNQVT